MRDESAKLDGLGTTYNSLHSEFGWINGFENWENEVKRMVRKQNKVTGTSLSPRILWLFSNIFVLNSNDV